MDQDRLFRLAPEGVAISAWFRPRQGWEVHLTVKRGDEAWSEAHQEVYTHLTTPELLDVVQADLATALGL